MKQNLIIKFQFFKLHFSLNYSEIKLIASSWQHTRTRLLWYSVNSKQGDGATTTWSSVNGNSRIFVRVLTRTSEEYVPFVTNINGILLFQSFWKKKTTELNH